MKVVDLRSDTVTRPTDAMREAMARAEVGDDVFGDDPTVNALQERIAAMLGKEAARACSTLPLHLVCRRATSRSTSNMVFADVQGERAAGLVDHLKSRGVLVTGLYRLRFVTHLDVDTEGVDRAIAAVREHLSA